MITYPEIFEMLRKEKYSDKLQDLGKGFVENLAIYLKEKKGLLEREREERPDFFNETLERTKKQLENARSMINELFMIRDKKLVNLALIASKTGISKTDLKGLSEDEKELFDTVLNKIKEREEKLITLIEGVKVIADDHILVKFNLEMPKFVDLKGNELGPFKEKDVANLPKKIAEALINNKTVEIVAT